MAEIHLTFFFLLFMLFHFDSACFGKSFLIVVVKVSFYAE